MGASLAKDVPFAALYWAMLEPLRASLMRHEYSTLADSFWQNSARRSSADVPVLPLSCLRCVVLGVWSSPIVSDGNDKGSSCQCLFVENSLAWCRAGNINELPVVPDVPALVRERTPAEILVINIAAAGMCNDPEHCS